MTGSMTRAPLRPARRRGVALADFIAGTAIFMGALGAFASLTRSKLEALHAADLHTRALAAAEAALDRVRLDGLPAAPAGPAAPDGFRGAGTLPLEARLPGGALAVEARALRVQGGDPRGLYEARVTVRWSSGPGGTDEVTLSTVVGAPARGGR